MRAKEALKKLNLYIKLMELHNENEFKIKQFNSFVYEIENSPVGIKELLFKAQKGEYKMTENKQTLLYDLLETETFPALDELLTKTPKGVIEMTKISGLGSKKVRQLWTELDIADLKTLQESCQNGEIAKLKGFGEKTEQNILQAVLYLIENQSKLLISQAEILAETIQKELLVFIPDLKMEVVGEIKRTMNTVSLIHFAVEQSFKRPLFQVLDTHDFFEKDAKNSSLTTWCGFLMDVKCPVKFEVLSQNKGLHLLKLNSSPAYLNTLFTKFTDNVEDELSVYQKLGKNFIPAPMRELENVEFINSQAFDLQKVVKNTDIKGCLHNHSLYSDGQHSIAQMAAACKSLGLTYFGISDHSKTASYAGGLSEEEIEKQHQEINDWNSRSTSFKIFKGIESDILNDGSLDYDPSILASFDFIVSSIHSNLGMKKDDATKRLITAIENPYTTILGHPTGRLLLKRQGYDLDFQMIIDACAENNVCIEINSNPWRLDLDWTFVRQAADKGVLLALNPDAHEIDGIHDMQYGLKVAQKVGLYPEQILNCFDLEKVERFFSEK
jgi:DNA polymerase (family X)